MNDQIGTRLAPNMMFQNLIGGRDRPASDGMELDVFSPVDGLASRPDRRRHGSGHRRGRQGRPRRLRRRLGQADRHGARTPAHEARVRRRGPCGRARHPGEPRQRQAPAPVPRRRHRARPLFRILRQRRRQAARRRDPLSRHAFRRRRARAARRDRAYRALELPDADLRTLRRCGARRRQRHAW